MITTRYILAFTGQVLLFILLSLLLWRVSPGGFPLGKLAVLAVLLGVAARGAWVALQFSLSHFLRSPRREDTRLGCIGSLYMVFTEVLLTTLMICLFIPLANYLVARRRAFIITSQERPVLLIHGYATNCGIWTPMMRYLIRRGVTSVFTMNLEPRFGDIDEYAQQVAAQVTRIRNTTRASKVVLVAHSMGGLVARAYIERFGGAARVAKLVTIGTPHHGTAMARIAPGVNGTQMRRGNAWLDALNRDENYGDSVPYVSIYSTHDNVVFPQNSAEFGKARNVEIVGRGHFTLIFSKEVGRLVYREIVSA